jgi:hypothetical protein
MLNPALPANHFLHLLPIYSENFSVTSSSSSSSVEKSSYPEIPFCRSTKALLHPHNSRNPTNLPPRRKISNPRKFRHTSRKSESKILRKPNSVHLFLKPFLDWLPKFQPIFSTGSDSMEHSFLFRNTSINLFHPPNSKSKIPKISQNRFKKNSKQNSKQILKPTEILQKGENRVGSIEIGHTIVVTGLHYGGAALPGRRRGGEAHDELDRSCPPALSVSLYSPSRRRPDTDAIGCSV